MEFLFIGLGNTGDQYKSNRHNVGFMFADKLADNIGISFTSKFSSMFGHTQFYGSKLLLQKPGPYINLSGNGVLQAHMFFKVPHKHIFVFYDDLDLAVGRIKVKLAGGSGGHNGIRSIDSAIGQQYHRIRIGIGRPTHGDISNYVLSNFTKDEQEILDSSIECIA
ncbi:MAG: aminoacyl-tRNA hydrolase, partial [Alphaproteobacteria bacterium]